MGKTYSVEKFWRDELKKNPDAHAGRVWEKLNRHPNKKAKKGSHQREYRATGNATCAWRNPLGEEHDKSSRIRLVRKAGVGILRARLKNEVRQMFEDSINEE